MTTRRNILKAALFVPTLGLPTSAAVAESDRPKPLFISICIAFDSFELMRVVSVHDGFVMARFIEYPSREPIKVWIAKPNETLPQFVSNWDLKPLHWFHGYRCETDSGIQMFVFTTISQQGA